MTRRSDDDSELEFLPPDERAFGDTSSADFVGVDTDDQDDDDHTHQGPRWPRGAAGALVIGLLAAGIVAADPWGNADPVPPPSTPPAVTVPTPTDASSATGLDDGGVTAAGDPLADVPITPAGFVVDELPSDRWVFTGTYSIPEGTVLSEFPMEVWAEPGATRTAGRWVSIRVVGDYSDLLPGAERLAAGVRSAVVTDRAGVTLLRVEDAPNRRTYELEGFGLSLEAMRDLAAQVDQTDGRLSFGSAAAHLTGMQREMAALRPPWSTSVFGNPGAVTNYFDPTAEAGVEIAFRPGADETSAALFLQPTDRPGTFLLSGDTDRPVAIRPVTGGIVTVTGYRVAPETVTSIADSIRRATLEEWRSTIVRTNRGLATPATSAAASRSQRGDLADGSQWTAIQTPRFVYGGSPAGNWYGEVTTDNGAHVAVLANTRLTLLVATVTWPSPQRTLRVTLGDEPPVDVVLEQLGDAPIFGAVFPVTALGPVSYELL